MADTTKCLICGCEDSMACMTDMGPCFWIMNDGADGVCSACEEKALEIVKANKESKK